MQEISIIISTLDNYDKIPVLNMEKQIQTIKSHVYKFGLIMEIIKKHFQSIKNMAQNAQVPMELLQEVEPNVNLLENSVKRFETTFEKIKELHQGLGEMFFLANSKVLLISQP